MKIVMEWHHTGSTGCVIPLTEQTKQGTMIDVVEEAHAGFVGGCEKVRR